MQKDDSRKPQTQEGPAVQSANSPPEIKQRAFEFALRVLRVCQHLDAQKGSSWVLSRQLLRSATSVGANLEEAQAAHSKADFICKAEIALKEAREARYWLRLVAAAELVTSRRILPLQKEAEELARVLVAVVVSAKSRASLKIQ